MERPEKEMQRNTVDHLGQGACDLPNAESVLSIDSDGQGRAAETRTVEGDVEESVGPNQDNGTTHNTPGLVANISRCLQRMEAEWEDAFTICLKDNMRISLIKGDDKKFKHDLREALRDARLRMTTRKDLREDAAKGIDKAAPLHLMSSRQLTQWQR